MRNSFLTKKAYTEDGMLVINNNPPVIFKKSLLVMHFIYKVGDFIAYAPKLTSFISHALNKIFRSYFSLKVLALRFFLHVFKINIIPSHSTLRREFLKFNNKG